MNSLKNTSKFTKNLIRRNRVVPSWWTDRWHDKVTSCNSANGLKTGLSELTWLKTGSCGWLSR